MANRGSPASIEAIKAFKRRENSRKIKEKYSPKRLKLQIKEAFVFVGSGMVLARLEGPQKEPGCWLWRV